MTFIDTSASSRRTRQRRRDISLLVVGLVLCVNGMALWYELGRWLKQADLSQASQLTSSQLDDINKQNTQALVPGLLTGGMRAGRFARAGGARGPGGPGGGPGGPGGPRFNGGGGPARLITGLVTVGNSQLIRTGQYLVRVVPGPQPLAPASFVFRQLNLIQPAFSDPIEFVIARRIVHEQPIATQLNVSPEQLAKLTAIVATPPVQEAYVVSLPVDQSGVDELSKAWRAYQTTPEAGKDAMAMALVPIAERVGDTGVTRAKQDYVTTTAAINAVLKPEQVQAYKDGKSLAPPPPKPAPKPPASKPAPKPAVKPATKPITRPASRPRTRPTTRPPATKPAITRPASPATAPSSAPTPSAAPTTTLSPRNAAAPPPTTANPPPTTVAPVPTTAPGIGPALAAMPATVPATLPAPATHSALVAPSLAPATQPAAKATTLPAAPAILPTTSAVPVSASAAGSAPSPIVLPLAPPTSAPSTFPATAP